MATLRGNWEVTSPFILGIWHQGTQGIHLAYFIYVAGHLEAFDLVSPKNHWGYWTSMTVAQCQEGEGLAWGVIENAPPFLSFILLSTHGVFSCILSIIKSLKTCCTEPAEWWDWERRVEERWICINPFMHSKATMPICWALFFQEPGSH